METKNYYEKKETMNLKHYGWVFKGVLSAETCDNILNTALSREKETAITQRESQGHYDKGLTTSMTRDLKEYPLQPEEEKKLLTKRNASIVFLDEQWIFDLINSYINLANKHAGWNFQWDWTESSQFVEYKKDQFYSWHTDSSVNVGSNPKWKGSFNKTRKISSNIQLTDPSKYEGGLFQIDPRMHDPDVDKRNIWTAPRERGSVIVFPSFIWHRATPVTKGVRYSMTHWHWGYPWK